MVDHLRKTSEAIVLLLVVCSPWAFGCVHPFFRYCLTAGIAILLLLWAIELIVQPRNTLISRFQIPLLGLILIGVLQIVPLGDMLGLISPESANLQAELLPAEMEQLSDGSVAEIPAWSARGRISVYPAETMRRCLWLIQLVLLFTRIQDLASSTTLRRLCFACLINGSVLAYFSVIHHFTADPGKIYWTFQSLGAAFGPFVNRNHFAFYINICFGLSIGLLGSRQLGSEQAKSTGNLIESTIEGLNDSLSLWMASVLVFMLGAAILCSSRGGMISLAGALIVTAVFVASTGSFRHGWKWFVLAAGIFVLAGATQVWLGFDFVESRYADHSDNRTQLWLPLLQLVPRFPIVGSGLGTLAQLEPSTRSDGLAGDFYLEYAHNEYLQLAIETGIAGLLLGCAFLLLLTTKIAVRIRESRHNAWLYVGLLFSLATICLHSFTEFGLDIPAIGLLAAVVFGHIAGASRSQPAEATTLLAKSTIRLSAFGLIAIAAISVGVAKQSDLAERSNVIAQRLHKSALQLKSPQRKNQSKTQPDVLAMSEEQRLELSADQIEQAIQHYDLAAWHSPDIEPLLDASLLRLDARPEATLADAAQLLQVQKAIITARELSPLCADANFLIGEHDTTFQAAEPRLRYLLRACKARPSDATLEYITGLEYLGGVNPASQTTPSTEDLAQAAEHLQRSIDLATRTHLYSILELTENRLQLVELEELLPNDNALAFRLAADWLEERNPDNLDLANSLRRKALGTTELKNPQDAVSNQQKAVLHTQLGDRKAAIQAYTRALRYEPEQFRWRLELARLLGMTKDGRPAAHQNLRQILQQRPGYPAAIRLRDTLIKERNE